MQVQSSDEFRFQLAWYELPGGPQPRFELCACIGMLCDVRECLSDAASHVDLQRGITLAVVLVEAYHQRLYFLRERAVGAMSRLTGVDRKEFKNAKAHRRAAAAEDARTVAPRSAAAYQDLMAKLGPDVELRNRHTHEQLVGFELAFNGDGWDPIELIAETTDPALAAALQHTCRRALARLADEYAEQAQVIIDATSRLVDALELESAPAPEAGYAGPVDATTSDQPG